MRCVDCGAVRLVMLTVRTRQGESVFCWPCWKVGARVPASEQGRAP